MTKNSANILKQVGFHVSFRRRPGGGGFQVARLSRLALTNMASAVSLYVKSGIASGTAAPVPLAPTGLVVCRRIDRKIDPKKMVRFLM